MKKQKWLPLVLSGAMVAGCMSLEERLQSNDPEIKRQAEIELVQTSRGAQRTAAIQRLTDEQVIASVAISATGPNVQDGIVAVQKLKTEKLLVDVAIQAQSLDISKKALEGIKDQSQLLNVGVNAKSFDLLNVILGRCDQNGIVQIASKHPNQKMREKAIEKITDQKIKDDLKNQIAKQISQKKKMQSAKSTAYIIAQLGKNTPSASSYEALKLQLKNVLPQVTEPEDLKKIGRECKRFRQWEYSPFTTEYLPAQYIKVSKTPDEIYALINGKCWIDTDHLSSDAKKMAGDKLSTMVDLINDEKCAKELFNSGVDYSAPLVKDKKSRAVLMTKIKGSELKDIIVKRLDDLNWKDVDDWKQGKLLVLDDAISAMSILTNDSKSVRLIADAILFCKIREKETILNDVFKSMPKIDDDDMAKLICGHQYSERIWQYFLSRASDDVAYEILVSGKAEKKEVEAALLKKLPQNRIDIKVYTGAKFDETRKSLPKELMQQASKDAEKVFEEICVKAKKAGNETFELDGFYLGMTYEEMKAVFAHHFPKIKFTREAKDKSIDGKIDARVIYIDGQTTPVCYANVSDNKVTQFNFGKKLLKKWYQYDVQNYAEWAQAYAREQKIKMPYKQINDETTVFEQDLSSSHKVWFHQEAYQYKNNKKNYRVTYFGEEKDDTIQSGLNGAVIKALAAKDFRFVRGDPGTLRIAAEED